jgi:hypothetical protein
MLFLSTFLTKLFSLYLSAAFPEQRRKLPSSPIPYNSKTREEQVGKKHNEYAT